MATECTFHLRKKNNQDMSIMATGKIIFEKAKMVNVFITMTGTISEIGIKIIDMDSESISISIMMRDTLENGNLIRGMDEVY